MSSVCIRYNVISMTILWSNSGGGGDGGAAVKVDDRGRNGDRRGKEKERDMVIDRSREKREVGSWVLKLQPYTHTGQL